MLCSFPSGRLELPASRLKKDAIKDVILIAVRCDLEAEGQTGDPNL